MLARLFGLGLISGTSYLLTRSHRFDKQSEALSDAIWKDGSLAPSAPQDLTELEQLPAPVQRFLKRALPEARPRVQGVRLRQTGEFRLRDTDTRWLTMSATQSFSTLPRAFIWHATLQVAPFAWMRVRDTYREWTGNTEARLFGAFGMQKAGDTPEHAESALVRYAAECAWFPTALLPGHGISWQAIDDQSARVLIKDGSVQAAIDCHFNQDGDLLRASAERYRPIPGGYAKYRWTAHFAQHDLRGGMRIPLEARAVWHLPSGDHEYFRAAIVDTDYLP